MREQGPADSPDAGESQRRRRDPMLSSAPETDRDRQEMGFPDQ
jgi:hypothetical protein